MDHSAIQKRLTETEERIALGQRQVAQQQELIVKLEADGQSAALQNICWLVSSCCKLPGVMAATSF